MSIDQKALEEFVKKAAQKKVLKEKDAETSVRRFPEMERRQGR